MQRFDKRIPAVPFTKYKTMGPYHWLECERQSSRYNPPLEARYEIVVRHLQNARRVLDVGCGDGYLMGRLNGSVHEVIGIDREFDGVCWAKRKLRHFSHRRVAQADCYKLPFENSDFDLVLLTDVIEHLESPETCLSEIGRVLAPDGSLVITTPKRRSNRVWDSYHIHEYTSDELEALLKNFFLEVKLVFFSPFFWSKLYATKYGWWLVRFFCRYFPNPFLNAGNDSNKYGQMLALCKHPR